MHRKVMATAAAVLAVSMVGCGGSPPLTSAELSRQANAICRRRDADAARLRTHMRDLHALFIAAIPIETKMVDDLSKLKPPPSARSAYGRFVAMQKVNLAGFKSLASGKRASDAEESRRLHELWRLTEQLAIADCR